MPRTRPLLPNRIISDLQRIKSSNSRSPTSAILDRLLHHAETVVIEGKSYRMKGKIEQ